jgi:hypothetical protein
MAGRTVLFIGILLLAVGVPYLLRSGGPLRDASTQAKVPTDAQPQSTWQRWWDKVAKPSTAVATDPATAAFDTSQVSGHPTPAPSAMLLRPQRQPQLQRPVPARQLAGPAGISMAEALRFDINPQWVAEQWSRVTTRLPDAEYQGLRVPLVTGTELYDLAGSLSYYFNEQNQMERLGLMAYTGDFEPLAALVQQRFGLTRYASVGPGLFMSFQQGQPIGVLHVEEPPVVTSGSPQARYRVELELNVPRPGAHLSPRMMTRVRKLRAAKMF